MHESNPGVCRNTPPERVTRRGCLCEGRETPRVEIRRGSSGLEGREGAFDLQPAIYEHPLVAPQLGHL